jgi:hypothetical protein
LIDFADFDDSDSLLTHFPQVFVAYLSKSLINHMAVWKQFLLKQRFTKMCHKKWYAISAHGKDTVQLLTLLPISFLGLPPGELVIVHCNFIVRLALLTHHSVY